MRAYEAMFVMDNGPAKKDFDGLARSIQDLVRRHGGEVTHQERWDERRLEYPIRGQRRATYLLVRFQGDPARIAALERDCGLQETILRGLITVFDPKARPVMAGGAEKGRPEDGGDGEGVEGPRGEGPRGDRDEDRDGGEDRAS